MIDFANITVKAGNGGNGAGSFEHVKGKRRGKADGGDGGRGGDVYIVASANLNTLEPFRFVKEYKAEDGRNGLPKKCTGAVGATLEIKVPVGTVAKISNFKFQISNFFDLTQEGQKVLVARGGDGGRGNRHMRDEFGRRPFAGEKGGDGEAVDLELQLKLIADVGLVGLPNGGKSTLLSKLTAATPKIAPYPFTTLEPNLGVMQVKVQSQSAKSKTEHGPTLSTSDFDSRLVVADIPGLIEGASGGKGLGDLFLRHIERTKILVHIIDATSDDVIGSYQTIRAELKAYSVELAKKKEIVVLNKIDLVSRDVLDAKVALFKKKRKKVFAVSAQGAIGLEPLVGEIVKRLS